MNSEALSFPTTRAEALERLREFIPKAEQYAARRNYVEPPYDYVSRLSPAISRRLILEREVCEAAREAFSPSAIQKFEQEVWWRTYWKGWLEMRPSIWTNYRTELAELDWDDYPRAQEVARGESGVEIMDYFARELFETGYMHNHARMWWAAFWIHVEKLPWQLGADFFLQHLFDGDAASNTLSWRWVAGLHTKGKNYLVRRSNIEKYVAPEILRNHKVKLEALEHTTAVDIEYEPLPEPKAVEARDLPSLENQRVGIWLHENDLLPEKSPLQDFGPVSVRGFTPEKIWSAEQFSKSKRDFLTAAMKDGLQRAEEYFSCASGFQTCDVLEEGLANWVREENLDTVVTLHPFTGVLGERLSNIETTLRDEGVNFYARRRPEDVEPMNKATSGFFGFWKKTEPLRRESADLAFSD
ncbi:MAG: DNA photolyase [Verrucomicrobiales bacterium]|nr:DNA photolyase [Verrucomicrobiales bacterium]